MTFNTTSLPLWRAIRQQKALLEYVPMSPLSDQRRWLIVTPYIHDLLRGQTQVGEFPDVAAEILISRYAAGYLVTVSRQLTEEHPDIEQIVDADEVWAFCPRRPRPGWRILGRFYEKDVFIALRPWDKVKLAGNYGQACAEVIKDWGSLFGPQPPHAGNSVADYLSGVTKDVDQQP